jgi:hypothetical protein
MTIDKQAIRADKYLRLMMTTGIPLALIALLSLWVGQYLGSSGIGVLFLITFPLALVIGFAYNIRYVMLAARQRRQQQSDKE